MRLTFFSVAGLVLSVALIFGQTALQQAYSQTPSAPVQSATGRPLPSENLPSDFIDSRPILAYFADWTMPDTVRGLLEELKRPDRCGQGAGVRPAEACALVFYKLDDEFTPDRLRPPFMIKAVYRVTAPENLANTVITMPDSKGALQRYAGSDMYEPLRNVRANICLLVERTGGCAPTQSKGVLYRPYAILGKIENDREGILPTGSARKHFTIDPESPQFADWLKTEQLLEICRLNGLC
jgi:hypothetical protein